MRALTMAGRFATTLLLLMIALAGVTPGVATAKLGVSSFSLSLASQQAGAHTDQTASFEMSTEALGNPTGQLKDVTVTLPPGMVGNPEAIPRCPIATFEKFKCPSADQIGVLETSFMICQGAQQPLTVEAPAGATTIRVADASEFCPSEGAATIGSGPSAENVTIEYIEEGNTLVLAAPLEHSHMAGEDVTHIARWYPVPLPMFNLQPLPGHQATFGAEFILATLLVNVDLPRGGNGGLKATISDASTLLGIKGAALTLWGVPSSPSHDALRCGALIPTCDLPPGEPVPFMSNSTDCSVPLESTLTVTSYEGESASAATTLPPLTGCEALQVSPEISVAPETTQRDVPTGYEIDVKVPQSTAPEGLATPDLRDVSITLPAGTTLSPSMANGLQACSESQFADDDCPNAAKVGTATLSTPLLPEALTGAIYIGQPSATEKYPLRLSLSGDGTTVQLTGQAEPDPMSGQVTTVFTNAPQLPFSELELNLFGGPTAALANPEACGPATSSAQILSYGGQLAKPSSTFLIDNDGQGGACPPVASFAPSFTAGTLSPLAGGFSPLTLTVSRAEGEQNLSAFNAQLPPGLLGMLASVPLCPEPQAASGACPQSSQVGTATVLAGAGTQPLAVSGPVYLTGPYDGAPLGLVTSINAAAGPFELGTTVVRSRILIDPTDLHLTILSDQFPQIMSGIPLRLRTVNITLNRPGFILNPADCSAMTISGTVDGSAGAEAAVSSPFRVAGCEGLPFAPRLTASTKAGASIFGNGAALNMEITTTAQSSATIHAASIQLPKQLRPRLNTIQHACLATTVKNLAECPSESQVGRATVVSPVVLAPLTGPVLLVAHGGAAPPSLVLLLRSEGVSVELTATLSISKHGPITATFPSLPDVPISRFELALPAGPHSMLAAVEGVCRGTLAMPYRFTDQSGAAVAGSTHIAVSGCRRRTSVRSAKAGRAAAGRRDARRRPDSRQLTRAGRD